jgi:hypothetical protein
MKAQVGANSALDSADNTPLCVDLDGTLTCVDTLHESLVELVKCKPWLGLMVPIWLLKGKAHMKAKIAEVVVPKSSTLPYHDDVVSWARDESTRRPVYLATAAHEKIANDVAKHLGFFSGVFSTTSINLSSSKKADALTARFGVKGFDYAGNSADDIAVWRAARQAVIVDAPISVSKYAKSFATVSHEFAPRKEGVVGAFLKIGKTWIKALRIYQWVKNFLVFLPLVAHIAVMTQTWRAAWVAFFAFGLAASGIYLINDLFDLEADRAHTRKCKRPFASGALPSLHGLFAAPFLVVASLALAYTLHWKFVVVIVIYLVTTTLYSVWLKRKLFIDTFISRCVVYITCYRWSICDRARIVVLVGCIVGLRLLKSCTVKALR